MAEAKKFFRCGVCGDIHYGANFPSPCPTCSTPNAYLEISAKEAAAILGMKAK